jgi:hypothetical protein
MKKVQMNFFHICPIESKSVALFKIIEMILHTDLSKYGFLQLKKDRDELISQINELQSLLDDFNFVYPFYKNIYEPEIEILTKDDKFYGRFDVNYPSAPEPITYDFEIGQQSSFEDINDSRLKSESNRIASELLKEKFPLHFKDGNSDK